MRIVLFHHSLISDWNNGNAHFLRGIASELLSRGHEVQVYEPHDGWSLSHLIANHGTDPIRGFRLAYPELRSIQYNPELLDPDETLDGADLVIVHEWNDPAVVNRIGEHHARSGGYVLLFHDTHHRSVTDPGAMSRYDLSGYDGVLAFGAVIGEIYRKLGWARRIWVWHEAADTRVFYPRKSDAANGDLVWIGNWGDGERTAEIDEFLLEPIRALNLTAKIYGVRYPEDALVMFARSGIEYGGWIANFRVPDIFSSYSVTVHIPRRPYAELLPGIPTIRVFEALACGIPLVSAPWDDAEGLFTPGEDFLFARDGSEMIRHLKRLLSDPGERRERALRGLAAIRSHPTCSHRADELLAVYESITSVSKSGDWNIRSGISEMDFDL